ncbi:hypothetical protein BCLUESOX_1083 [bacterium endosymbiont of Bathymodiolus sp. 5 South]|nr:hypothetical protein BCLUESOX_1083 [bacterium endosymbiont of Bathymodiolus sp. 5 South]
MDGSMAISALARKVFFQFCRFCGRMLCLLAICTKVLLFCNNSSTNFVLNAEVYLVRFLLIFLLRFFCLV